MSEKIRWVSTPKCSECQTPMALKGRYCCIGCDRQKIQKKYKPLKANRNLDKKEISKRNLKIAEMRSKGFSYNEIARALKIPRATVQSAAAAAKLAIAKEQGVKEKDS